MNHEQQRALDRIGVSHADVLSMRADMLAAIKRSNNDLIHMWSGR